MRGCLGESALVIWMSATRRTREIGIRMALGSGLPSLMWLIIQEALQLVGIGCGVGVLLAVAMARWIAAYLFGVASLDPLTLSAAAGLMLVMAAAAVCAPVLRTLPPTVPEIVVT